MTSSPAYQPDQSQNAERPQLEALTSLRFFAATSIIFQHLTPYLCEPGHEYTKYLALHQGVSFFFVLSGFILTYVHPSLPDLDTKLKFLKARFARIYPIHVAALLFTILLIPQLATKPNFPLVLTTNFLLIHDWIPLRSFYYSLNVPSWSISCEFFFYTTFLLLIGRLERYWAALLAGSFALAVSCVLIDISLQDLPASALNQGLHMWLVIPGPPVRIFEFCLGMSAALLFSKLRLAPNCPRWLNSVTEISLVALCFAAMIAPSKMTELTDSGMLDWRVTEYFRSSGGAVIYASLILVFAMKRGRLSRMLSSPVFVLLGQISFSMYLFHNPLMVLLREHKQILAPFNKELLSLATFILLLALSSLTFIFIETPCRNWLASKPAKPLSKNTKLLSLACAFVIVVCSGAIFQLLDSKYTSRFISERQLKKLQSSPQYEITETDFDGKLRLESLRLLPLAKQSTLSLTWKNLRMQRQTQFVAVHLLDASDGIVQAFEYELDHQHHFVLKNRIWTDSISIPVDVLSKASKISIGIYTKSPFHLYEINKGNPDDDGKFVSIHL